MLITFEGIEGCGKSTQARMLYEWIREKGHNPLLSREPGSSPLGEKLRAILLSRESGDISPLSELFLYLADRAEHVQQLVKPALDEDRIVIIDRYVDSTLVYQGYGRGFELPFLQQLNARASCHVWPTLTFLLDLPPEKGLQRAKSRNVENAVEIEEGRFEAESWKFHQKIRNGYLELARQEQDRFVVLDALEPAESVFESVKNSLQERLGGLYFESHS
ncbi:MAG: dTMP kinase [Thermodesulfobacteriota bacterium]